MKCTRFILICLLAVAVFSCKNDDEPYETIQVAVAQVMSKSDFRKSVEILTPRPIEKSGKIYVYQDYIFVSDAFKGVHIIDNTIPTNPKAKAYLKIPANEDISIKDNFLYADSATDLLVFDLSDINNISLEARLEDVFDVYDFQIPVEAERVDYTEINYQTEIIIGWTITTERREQFDDRMIDFALDGRPIIMMNATRSESTTGQGGSLARFQIVDDYLYAVGSHQMAIFNIQNLEKPTLANTQYAGNNIETLFQADGYLYIGSTDGMYIYDLENAENPTYVSEFVHWTGCDPVVVDGDYAFLTLRGGNNCGEQESVLEVIDIKDKANPKLAARYELDNPYGLGFMGNRLFVCDGTSGLKIFDKTDVLDLKLEQQFKNIQSKDVIPLEDILIMIGDNVLYQYDYNDNTVNLISTYKLSHP
jgi:hypothetical protein